jgi:hydrogenase expression/formation protein HypE
MEEMPMDNTFPKLGKIPKEIFDRLIYTNTGYHRDTIVVPPKHGVDFGVVVVGDKALIVKTDPVFVVPEYGWERSAWFAFHILASDVATSGNPPMYMSIDLNLPQKMKVEEFEKLWIGIHEEAKKHGVSIISGHTGVYGGVDYPMIGGATMMTVTEKDHYITTEMARPGDLVIMTKGPAIETAGILSVMFPEVLEKHGGTELRKKGEKIFYRQTVVPDALELSELGLRSVVSSMHDATEYGVWGALHDISSASKTKIRVYKERLFIDPEVEQVLTAFMDETGMRFDPYTAISEGTLIATVHRDYGEEAVQRLEKIGIKAEMIGVVIGRGEGVLLNDNETDTPIPFPEEDPFWPLFFRLHKKLQK